MYAHILKYLRISKMFASNQNICAHLEISAHTQNFCLHVKYPHTSKIFALMKYSRLWNIRAHLKYLRIYKIYAPHQKCSRLIIYDSNKAAIEIFAPYKRCMRPNSYYLGSAESPTSDSFLVRLKSSRSGDVVSPPCSPQVGICSQTAQLIWAASLP